MRLLAFFSLNLCSVVAFRLHSLLPRQQHAPVYAIKKNAPTAPATVTVDTTLEPFNRKLVYGTIWTALVSYVFLLSPGGSPAAADLDTTIIQTMISAPFDGRFTPLFASVFNAFPIVSVLYSSLLLSGGKEQKLPTPLFVAASYAVGFFALGPYLGLRNLAVDVTTANKGRGTALFESKLVPAVMIGFFLYLVYYAGFGTFTGDRVAAYIELFTTQRLVHVSTIDLSLLALFLYDPIREDMRRRGWTGASAAAFTALPILGPLIYLLLRPALPEK